MLGNYSDEVLEKLHKYELNMLKEFDRICKKYDIKYFCVFGTALGAIRHNGFIPWDDDIDIGMLREDYEKLHNVPKSEWDSKYFLADPRDDYELHRTLFPRVYIKGTTFETEMHQKYLKQKTDSNYPIYMDIFIFDAVSNIEKLDKIIRKFDFYKRFVLYSKCKYNVIKSDPIKNRISCRIKRIMSYILKVANYSSKKIYNKYLKYIQHEQSVGGENSGYVTCLEAVTKKAKHSYLCKRSELFPTVEVRFEDMEVPMIKNYHEIMTKMYGDYKFYGRTCSIF